jgi:hypothetical protein
MKTKEKIEQLAEEFTNGHYHYRGKDAFIHGYTQCQKDMAHKRYTEEDLMNAFNAGINNDYGNGPSFDQWLNSLNKQD